MSAFFSIRDDNLAVELFRLRYVLREATNFGRWTSEVEGALRRLRELAERAGRGELLFEHRRWMIQLEMARAAA